MGYIDYNDYVNMGGGLDFAAFTKRIGRACGYVDAQTFGRLSGEISVSDAVKACLRDLVDFLESTDRAVSSKSQSIGGVSESENYAIKSKDDITAEMRAIVYDYLYTEVDTNGVPLLYRGAQ